MFKQTCRLIHAVVVESMVIPVVALALISGRALAAEPQKLDFKWLGDLIQTLEILDRNGSMAILFEPGGVIKQHIERWQELARSGADVEILDPCYSACTLIVPYVPKERLCFGAFATPQFHLAWNSETGKPSLDASLWMLKQYPREIYDWIMERGGVDNMTIRTFWEMRAPNLWRMGYRQCKRDQ